MADFETWGTPVRTWKALVIVNSCPVVIYVNACDEAQARKEVIKRQPKYTSMSIEIAH